MTDFLIAGAMSRRNEPICITERHEISALCLAGVVSYQGRQSYMEDTFKIISNINGSDISILAVCDGHAGNFASQYTSDIIIPCNIFKMIFMLNFNRIII
jgi:hypothetical protein